MSKVKISTSKKVNIAQLLVKPITAKYKTRVNKIAREESDRQIGVMFQWIANEINNTSKGYSNIFKVVRNQSRVPKWTPLTPEWIKVKSRKNFPAAEGGNDRFFSAKGDLAASLGAIGPRSVLGVLGKAKARVSDKDSSIKVQIAPNLSKRLYLNYLENQLGALLSKEDLVKLNSSSANYRPLIGPTLRYFVSQRIPRAIFNKLKKELK